MALPEEDQTGVPVHNARPTSAKRPEPERVGLPSRPFLFTLDQVAQILAIEVNSLRPYLYFAGVDEGAQLPKMMIARDISNDDDHRDWRVAEGEVIRWLRYKGFKIYDRGWAIK